MQKEPLTLLELSRATNISRTTLYRITENLITRGLLQKVVDYKTTRLKAAHPSILKRIVQDKLLHLKQIKNSLPNIINSLNALEHPSSIKATKILYYRGKRWLKQILWNTLKAKQDIVGYGYLNWNISVGKKFAENVRQEIVNRKIQTKELQNENFMQLHTFTQVHNYADFYKRKIIRQNIIDIKHDTYIYNDVIAFYYALKGEIFGFEIYNTEIAKTQRQIFYALWNFVGKEEKNT